jgi:hypothetical protein
MHAANHLKGAAGLIFVLGAIVFFLVFLPASRWFLAISVPAGLLIALILYAWRKLFPVDIDKR